MKIIRFFKLHRLSVLKLAEDVVAATRIASRGERVRVVSRHDDERVRVAGHLLGNAHCFVEGDRLVESDARSVPVMRVINTRSCNTLRLFK